MAVETAENLGLNEYCKSQELEFGIVKRSLKITTKELSDRLCRAVGDYTTFDCERSIYLSSRPAKAIETYLAQTIKRFIGAKSRTHPVLVACLGNGNIAADSLGKKVFDKLEVTSDKLQKPANKPPVCAISTSVLGKTGIQTSRFIKGVVKEIEPCFAVLIDSLATSVPKRVGVSFQLSTAGITPGSGVGGDKERIDSSVLGVPVLSIGVPMLLSLNTLTYGLFKDFFKLVDAPLDEYAFRSMLADRNMSNLVVAPKDVDVYAENASVLLSNALNLSLTRA